MESCRQNEAVFLSFLCSYSSVSLFVCSCSCVLPKLIMKRGWLSVVLWLGLSLLVSLSQWTVNVTNGSHFFPPHLGGTEWLKGTGIVYSWLLSYTGLNCAGPLTHAFFFNKYTVYPLYTWALFSQIKPITHWKQYFNPWLGIWGCKGPTVYIVLYHFIKGNWASMDFGTHREYWNQSPTHTVGL